MQFELIYHMRIIMSTIDITKKLFDIYLLAAMSVVDLTDTYTYT